MILLMAFLALYMVKPDCLNMLEALGWIGLLSGRLALILRVLMEPLQVLCLG